MIVLRIATDQGGFDWPAWIQAIGSVGAILLAIWISQRDARLRRSEDRAKKADFALYLVRHLDRVEDRLDEIERTNQLHRQRLAELKRVEKLTRPVLAISFPDWPDANTQLAYTALSERLKTTVHGVSAALDHHSQILKIMGPMRGEEDLRKASKLSEERLANGLQHLADDIAAVRDRCSRHLPAGESTRRPS